MSPRPGYSAWNRTAVGTVVGAKVGRFLEYDDLKKMTEGVPNTEAYRLIAARVQHEVENMRDGILQAASAGDQCLIWEAFAHFGVGVGAKATVKGGRVNIKIPAGAQNGQKLRVRSQGLPQGGGGRGDLYVVLRVQVPSRVSESERAHWERLARESRFNPRD